MRDTWRDGIGSDGLEMLERTSNGNLRLREAIDSTPLHSTPPEREKQ